MNSSLRSLFIWASIVAIVYGGAFLAVCWELLVHDPY